MNAKRQILATARFLIGIGLAFGLVYGTIRSTGGNPWMAIYHAKMPFLLTVLLLHGVVICTASYRWSLLLRVQGITLPLRNVIRLTMIGLFFNLALPGAVSGDLVKMSLIMKHSRDKKQEAILTILLDRALGLFGLFLLASLMVLLSLPFLMQLDQQYRPVKIASYVVGLGSVAGILGMGLIETRRIVARFSVTSNVVNFVAKKLPRGIVSCLERLVSGLELYRQNRSTILSAITLSVIVHLCLALNLFFIGVSIGEDILGLRHYFLASPVANAVAAIPITPGGIGTRDATIAMFFSVMGASPQKAGVVPVIMTFVILFWGLLGGITYVFSKSQKITVRTAREFKDKNTHAIPFLDGRVRKFENNCLGKKPFILDDSS
jgi:uncharacterized protein (TIRG00374 family)